MLDDCTMLSNICQNTEMGRTGIAHVMDLTRDTDLRQALEAQLSEYHQIYDAADAMLQEKSEGPEHISPMAKVMSYLSANFKTMQDPSSSKIAEMMIQGSTMGITKMTKWLHDYDGGDNRITRLAQKLVKTEQANIEEMKHFL
nr:hypothetical protein [Maliibacterium massiliense]